MAITDDMCLNFSFLTHPDPIYRKKPDLFRPFQKSRQESPGYFLIILNCQPTGNLPDCVKQTGLGIIVSGVKVNFNFPRATMNCIL